MDTPVEGVSYQCGEKTGVTDKDGKFEFEEGKNCVFSVGNITLRTVLADALEDNGYVFEDNILNAQLLQSLDIDANVSNGITISKDEVEVLKNVSQPSSETDIQNIIDQINKTAKLNLKFISQQDALKNLRVSVEKQIKNALKGKTFYAVIGDANGFFIDKIEINSDATSFTSTGYINDNETHAASLDINGSVIKIHMDDGSFSTFQVQNITTEAITLISADDHSLVKLFTNAKDAKDYYNQLIANTDIKTYVGGVYSDSFSNKIGYIKINVNFNTNSVEVKYYDLAGHVSTFNTTLNLNQYYQFSLSQNGVDIAGRFINSKSIMAGIIDFHNENGNLTLTGDWVASVR